MSPSQLQLSMRTKRPYFSTALTVPATMSPTESCSAVRRRPAPARRRESSTPPLSAPTFTTIAPRMSSPTGCSWATVSLSTFCSLRFLSRMRAVSLQPRATKTPAGPEFTSHSGYITVGGDLLEQSMTLEEAKQMCASLAQCKGFCYEGTPTPEGKVNVVFKNKWDLAGKAGWTSYRLEEQPASDVASLEYYSVGGRDVGRPGDLYEVRLQIKGKWKAVVWDRIGSSDSGVADAGTYYLVASWQDWEPVPMEKSASTAGLYTLDVTLVGGRFDRHVRGAFQVVRNKDPYQTFVPGSGKAAVGKEDLVSGPGEDTGLCWQIEGEPGEAFRIEFHRTVDEKDDAKTVTWQKVQSIEE
mmetsp:Transcript_70225/g.227363  ORF Transcript_70225/g.227363 Transcript_70225/m.227363 type:complete len:355 (+) Transcript_70225:1431-2495(+)